MSRVVFAEEAVLFSPDMPEAVNHLLHVAVVSSRHDSERAERLFFQALELDGACLQSYFALYKFYFYRARLMDAERIVLAALKEAARQGEFPFDFRQLARQRRWNLYAGEAALFYLYSLKALAFIKLRRSRTGEALSILAALETLDPEDRSGASVIMQLAAAVNGE